MNPVLATERTADVDGYCWCRQVQGQHDVHGMVGAILIPSTPPTADQRIARAVRCAWWEAHYWGRPTWEEERNLALLRAVLTLSEGEWQDYARRVMALLRVSHETQA